MPFLGRAPNTTRSGGPFDDWVVDAVWAKAKSSWLPGTANDVCGATIHRHDYGKVNTFGWEIDHVVPVARGGTDDLYNLQPLHWQNNRSKGDQLIPFGWCKVTS